MLQSVMSVTPIMFVQMGQQEAGAIDFRFTYTKSPYIKGNRNFYRDNPFLLNATRPDVSYENLPTASGKVSLQSLKAKKESHKL